MKKAKWAAVGISLLIAVSPPAKAQTATAAFTPTTGTNYVIRNVETGQFLRCDENKLLSQDNAAYFSSTIDDNHFFWQFSPLGNGWKIYNVGREQYLIDDATADLSGTYRGKTDATGAAWYITTNTWNKNGYLVSSSDITTATTATNCLYAYKSSKKYYLCSTGKETADLNPHGKSDYYQLPTFQFYTYDQLYDLAVKCGYTGDKGDATSVEAWNTLAKKIEEERQVTSDTVVSSYAGKGSNYVIASRRYH